MCIGKFVDIDAKDPKLGAYCLTYYRDLLDTTGVEIIDNNDSEVRSAKERIKGG